MILTANSPVEIELEALNAFINRHYGLDFCHQRLELLQDAVQKRIEKCEITSVSEYLNLVRQRKDEALLLINLLTVNETYFFREPTHFDILTMDVIPGLIKNGGGYPFFRLLSAGCSTGEEAYSLAIAALGLPGAGVDWDFEIIGIDVDNEAIKKAQAGIYGLYSFRACTPDIRNTYFEQVSEEKFAVKRLVKEKVRFEPLNLFEQEYPDWIGGIDAIFYRNVSIYFSKEQREAVFRRLTGLLNHDGCLFLSCTETLYHNSKLMALIKSRKAFYYQKQNVDSTCRQKDVIEKLTEADNQSSIRLEKSKKSFASPIQKRPGRTVSPQKHCSFPAKKQLPLLDNKSDWCGQMLAGALELIKLKRYDEAIVQLDEILAVDVLFIKAYTVKANILLNQQNVDAANAVCHAALEIDTFCLEAYLILGMAAKVSEKLEEAIQRFKEAVYVYPEGWLAHFFLAQVYQLRDETFYAKREYEVAMNLLKQGNFENHGLSFFLVPFRQEDFIQLCQHNIAKMKD